VIVINDVGLEINSTTTTGPLLVLDLAMGTN
jgi:hypothetical protein